MMTSLSVTRKIDQTVEMLLDGLHLVAGARIIVEVTRLGKKDMRMRITAPREVPILRGELVKPAA